MNQYGAGGSPSLVLICAVLDATVVLHWFCFCMFLCVPKFFVQHLKDILLNYFSSISSCVKHFGTLNLWWLKEFSTWSIRKYSFYFLKYQWSRNLPNEMDGVKWTLTYYYFFWLMHFVDKLDNFKSWLSVVPVASMGSCVDSVACDRHILVYFS